MTLLIEKKSPAMPVGQILGRGFGAANSTLVGALYLFLLHAPVQVLGAVAQSLQSGTMAGSGQTPDWSQLVLILSFSLGSFVFALAVFFLFPLVLGGILGQVRDRLESPQQPPEPFGHYGRTFYVRLLANLGLFTLVMMVIMAPVICIGMGLAFQDAIQAMPTQPTEGAPAPQLTDHQQLTRNLMFHPVMLASIAIVSLLMSALAMVYWVANSIVVAKQEGAMVSWKGALHFCRQNFSTVLVVWLLNFAVGLLLSPFGLVGQLGIVKDMGALVGLALLYSAFIGYWGLVLAGLVMSLYLARRSSAGQPEPDDLQT